MNQCLGQTVYIWAYGVFILRVLSSGLLLEVQRSLLWGQI